MRILRTRWRVGLLKYRNEDLLAASGDSWSPRAMFGHTSREEERQKKACLPLFRLQVFSLTQHHPPHRTAKRWNQVPIHSAF